MCNPATPRERASGRIAGALSQWTRYRRPMASRLAPASVETRQRRAGCSVPCSLALLRRVDPLARALLLLPDAIARLRSFGPLAALFPIVHGGSEDELERVAIERRFRQRRQSRRALLPVVPSGRLGCSRGDARCPFAASASTRAMVAAASAPPPPRGELPLVSVGARTQDGTELAIRPPRHWRESGAVPLPCAWNRSRASASWRPECRGGG